MSSQDSLVRGQGPDMKVVDRRHPPHSQQTIPHLTVLQSCWSPWEDDRKEGEKYFWCDLFSLFGNFFFLGGGFLPLWDFTFHEDNQNVPDDGEGGEQNEHRE